MPSPQAYIQTNRVALFDWLVLLTSFLMGFIFPDLETLIRSKGFYNWILASLLLYTLGAAFKDLPLSYRLRHSSKNTSMVPYVLFLVIGHWFIIFFLVLIAEPAFRYVMRLPAMTDENAASWQLMLSATIAATIITWLVYRTKSSRKSRKKYSSQFLFRMELLADLMLIAGVSIFSFVFWEKGAMAMLSRGGTKTISDIIFIFLFLAILFLFFYLPLRYLFFMEDRQRAGNRRRLLLIFGFILIKALFEMLNI